ILLELEPQPVASPAPRWAVDHLAALALHDPHGALAELREARLAPFDVLGERASARLQATLHAWLRCQGNRAATARSLGVHEQTVRYRMNQLRELLGEALADADARFELELALRGSGAGPSARP
ncbi:MAG TPA: helix-turn-helix domain-containing protein, partial [Solirubrobacteraceae bacterium]